jgi:hypothetical protein
MGRTPFGITGGHANNAIFAADFFPGALAHW